MDDPSGPLFWIQKKPSERMAFFYAVLKSNRKGKKKFFGYLRVEKQKIYHIKNGRIQITLRRIYHGKHWYRQD